MIATACAQACDTLKWEEPRDMVWKRCEREDHFIYVARLRISDSGAAHQCAARFEAVHSRLAPHIRWDADRTS